MRRCKPGGLQDSTGIEDETMLLGVPAQSAASSSLLTLSAKSFRFLPPNSLQVMVDKESS
jgi:hypothetical protein